MAYNRWYERDHFYAGCMVGPWLFAGSRWVAPRTLKDLRRSDGRGEVANPVDAGSYVAIYWVLEDRDAEHWKWAGEQVHWLYENGRGFAERSHVHTVLFDYLDTHYRDADPVPTQLALDHGYPGIALIATDRAEGVSEDRFTEWTQAHADLASSPIASLSSWRPQPRDEITGNAPMDLGTGTGGPERTMQLAFLESDAAEAWPQSMPMPIESTRRGWAASALRAPSIRLRWGQIAMQTNSGSRIHRRLAALTALAGCFASLLALPGCEVTEEATVITYDTPLLSGEAVRAQLSEACATAVKKRQPLLLEFSAPWCSDCQKLHRMKQIAVLASELAKWPSITINVGQFDAHRDLLADFEVKQIAHWAVLAPNDCERPVASWPRLAQRKLEPASGAERKASPADLASWLLQFRRR